MPFAVLVFGQLGYAFLIFFVIQVSNAWIAVLALCIFSAVLTFALIAVAYQYDDTCRRTWFAEVDSGNAFIGFSHQLRRQIVTLTPWIVLAALANAALAFVFLHSGPLSMSLYPAIEWQFKWEFEFEHIGILSPFVPITLFPIGFVTFGALWFVRHVQDRVHNDLESLTGIASKRRRWR